MQVGLGQFNNVNEIVYVCRVGRKLRNFSSLDDLRDFFSETGADTAYDLELLHRMPRVYPLSPSDKEYVTNPQK